MNENRISISPGNSKMGYIPSVSLPPVITCADGCKCAKKCYAAKLCRIYPSVKKAYAKNLDILNNDINVYFQQVEQAASVAAYFRYHVSGDIPSALYLEKMISTARKLKSTKFLCFTKKYDLINTYLDKGGKIPKNLKIIFSAWEGMPMDNRHNLPQAHVIFKGSEPEKNWLICGGNCSACACRGVGCWQLKNGQKIAFYEH